MNEAARELLLKRLAEKRHIRQRLLDLEPFLKPAVVDDTPAHPSSPGEPEKPTAPPTGRKLIQIVESDPDLRRELATQVGYYGYLVEKYGTWSEFQDAVRQRSPSALVLDVALADGNGAEALMAWREREKITFPALFISTRDDLQTRLQTVNAGGAAFCPKPIDFSYLIDLLDTLTDDQPSEPGKVLIVDDSVSLAEYYAILLQGAGMETRVVTDPLLAMEPLEQFQPDLVLMDIYMPHCSGVQLAAVIRQQRNFDGIPIVYLSGETDPEKQRHAVAQGGDDFLTKPIQPVQLIASVTTRIERYRKLRAMMVRDGMTGLYNHAHCKELMVIEVDRAQRRETPLTFAVLDIDKFKSVNDTYGHPVGDRVIKSLARVLKQRLRKTDILSRFGGEEFVVLLPETDAETAATILNELRVAFSQIKHAHEGTIFNTTFSCGLALHRAGEHPEELNRRADEALYKAKQGGRNRVVVD